MAPFRNRDRSNRSGRGQIEHNVLEGLPIHQYREVEVTVGVNAADNKPIDKDAWPELPMPRDSHMLPEHSQQLLRAARSGRIYTPPAPPEDDNEMKDEEEENKQVQTGFTIKKYVKVARHLEVSEPEYLAKRRKGLPSPYVTNGSVQAPLRETKVKKLDAEGNATVYKVLVPEGQAVEGEVQPTDAAIEAELAVAAPGTIVEGVGIVNAEGLVVANDVMQQTPPRRRNPPPKKKRHGPGRSKKKVVFIEGSTEQGDAAENTGGDRLAVPGGIKQEGGSAEPSDGDTPMGNTGGEDEEGSGEEGSDDEGNEMDHTSAPDTPATPLRPSAAPTSVPSLDSAELATLESAASAASASAPEPREDPSQGMPADNTHPLAHELTVPETDEPKTEHHSSSSPDLPLSTVSDSRQNSLNQIPTSVTDPESMSLDPPEPVAEPLNQPITEPLAQEITEAVVERSIEPSIEAVASPVAVAAVEQPVAAVVGPVVEAVAAPVLEPAMDPMVERSVQAVPTPEEARPTEISAANDVEASPSLARSEHASAPPSEPDLMGSLERHLEEGNEDMGGS